MAKGLLKFTCQNTICDKRENFVELPESEAKRTRWLLYCGNCGRVVQTKMAVERDNQGNSVLPCIEYTGPGNKLTRGPVPHDIYGIAWGVPDGNANISEEEFIKKYGINPRIDWCNRTNSKNANYDKICKARERNIKPVEYRVFETGNGGHASRPRPP